MKAAAGNWLIVESNHLNGPSRRGLVVEVHGANGEPPYVVRWDDSGHETLFVPGPDTHVTETKEEHQI